MKINNAFFKTGLFFIVLLVLPLLTGNDYELRLLMRYLIYGILAVGLNILVGYAGLISLGHAGLFALGSYVAAILSINLGFDMVLASVCAVIITTLIGVCLAYPTVRVRGVYLAVITIAFGLIVENVAIEWKDMTGGTMGLSGIDKPNVFGFMLGDIGFYVLLAILFSLSLLFSYNFRNSRFGRMMVGVSKSEIAGQSLGINVTSIRVLAFALSAGFAGLAGALFAYLNSYISPDIFTFSESIRFLLMVIVGGAGTLAGVVIGTGILTFLPEFLQQFAYWQEFAYGALLLAVMLVVPNGIVGTIQEHYQRIRKKSVVSVGQASKASEVELGSVLNLRGKAADLKVNDVTMKFGGLVALQDVGLDLEKNQVHALIGPNGAGKSTLINVITGFYKPTEGSVSLNGENITGLAPNVISQKRLIRTFQNTELFNDLSVYDNVLIGRAKQSDYTILDALVRSRKFRSIESSDRQKVLAILDFLNLTEYESVDVNDLPFGIQRRLEIGRALAAEPNILFLDEPAAGLTKPEIDELGDYIRKILDNGVTILLIEHHIEFVMEMASRITVLDFGKVIACDTPSNVQSNKKVLEAYLG